MKVDNSLSAVTAIEPQARRQTTIERSSQRDDKVERDSGNDGAVLLPAKTSASFGIQLNQQLSAMQSAGNYLDGLATRLGQLKLTLSRELSGSQTQGRTALERELEEVEATLAERHEQSGGVLDATFKLRLSEPVRVRFSIDGLASTEAMRRSGGESLLFGVGRSGEPLAVVLEDDMSDQQILRRLNAGLGQVGIRAELDTGGELKFSAPEATWQALADSLRVKGEGKLFAGERFAPVSTQVDELIQLPSVQKLGDKRELRRTLDLVVQALGEVDTLREQLVRRQEDIRDFLARRLDEDEQRWASDYATTVFNLMRKSEGSYDAVTRMVLAQATINRFTMVSLLS